MQQNDPQWTHYYERVAGREPRQLVRRVLTLMPTTKAARFAIDLGCGNGTETLYLLERGWHVLAIDGQAQAIDILRTRVPDDWRDQLETRVQSFVDVALPPADLIHASYSLPFCPPQQFDAFWQKIVDSIRPGGYLAAEFFGERDSWAQVMDTVTFHSEAKLRARLAPFALIDWHERDAPGHATSGAKHWHVFTVIARKL